MNKTLSLIFFSSIYAGKLSMNGGRRAQILFCLMLLSLNCQKLMDGTNGNNFQIARASINLIILIILLLNKKVSVLIVLLQELSLVALLGLQSQSTEISFQYAILVYFVQNFLNIILLRIVVLGICVGQLQQCNCLQDNLWTILSFIFMILHESYQKLQILRLEESCYQGQQELEEYKFLLNNITNNVKYGISLILSLKEGQNTSNTTICSNQHILNLPLIFLQQKDARRRTTSTNDVSLNELLKEKMSYKILLTGSEKILAVDEMADTSYKLQPYSIATNNSKYVIITHSIDDNKSIKNSLGMNATQMMGTLNHKLKTSLSSALIHLVSANSDSQLDLKFKQLYTLPTYYNCQSQLFQVQDVLDFLSLDIEMMCLSRKQENIVTIARQALLYVGKQCEEKQIQLNLKVNGFPYEQHKTNPIILYTDENKLHRILFNLLNNSYRNTPSNGIITISIEQNYQNVYVQIIDTGTGFKQHKVSIVTQNFDEYEQSVKAIESSYGIGLAITNKMASILNSSGKPLKIIQSGQTGTIIEFMLTNIEVMEGSIHSRSLRNIENFRSQSKARMQSCFSSLLPTPMRMEEFNNNEQDSCYQEPEASQLPCLKTTNDTSLHNKVIPRTYEHQQTFGSNYKSSLLNFDQIKETKQVRRGSQQSQSQFLKCHNKQLIINYEQQQQSYRNSLHQIDQQATSSGTIIIVDDEPFNHTSITMMLKQLNLLDVVHLYDGQQFIDYVTGNTNIIKAVLMDVDMPVMDGITATQTAIERQQLNQLAMFPIIGCTAHQDQFTQEECLKVGMVALLIKPVFKRKLVEILKYIEGSVESYGRFVQQSSKFLHESG